MDLAEWGRNWFLIIMALLVLVTVALWQYAEYMKRCDRREAIAKSSRWTEAVLAAEGYEAVLAVGGTPGSRLEEPYTAREQQAVEAYELAVQQREDANYLADYKNASYPAAKLHTLLNAIRSQRDVVRLFGLPDALAVTGQMNDLLMDILTQCYQGDTGAISSYRHIVEREWPERAYAEFGVHKPDYPYDWDGVVMRYLPNYSMMHLRGTYRTPRQVVEAAAMLLAKEHPMPTKLRNVLAYAYLLELHEVALQLQIALERGQAGHEA